jgi:hypothetical protein
MVLSYHMKKKILKIIIIFEDHAAAYDDDDNYQDKIGDEDSDHNVKIMSMSTKHQPT